MPAAAATGLITSVRQPRVAAARRLGKRAFRHSARRFLVEGAPGVAEGLREPGALVELFVTDEAAGRYADLVASAERGAVDVHRVSAAVMAQIAQTVTPQGILGVAPFRDCSLAELPAPLRLVAVLAGVRDPGNAGTLLRSADASGADGVVFSSASVDAYNPKCTRASAGSLFHIPFVVDVEIGAAVGQLRDQGLRVLAADVAGSDSLDDADLSAPTAWLFGNEAWGLPGSTAALADQTIRVPIHGRAESLNLATAAALCLYASARVHRGRGGCRA